ncbi:MAG: hypothetical protein ABJ360_01070, partial [Roseobacter sp.]
SRMTAEGRGCGGKQLVQLARASARLATEAPSLSVQSKTVVRPQDGRSPDFCPTSKAAVGRATCKGQ